jgi:hypothetical protein
VGCLREEAFLRLAACEVETDIATCPYTDRAAPAGDRLIERRRQADSYDERFLCHPSWLIGRCVDPRMVRSRWHGLDTAMTDAATWDADVRGWIAPEDERRSRERAIRGRDS